MEKYSNFKRIAFITGLAIFFAIFVTRPGMSQDTAKKEGKKNLKIKIVREDEGKTTVIDTTISVNFPFDKEEVKELINNLKEMNMEMKGLHSDAIVDFDYFFSDSTMKNSQYKLAEGVYLFGEQGKCPGMVYHRGSPNGLTYKFNMPDIAETVEGIEEFNWVSPEDDHDAQFYYNRKDKQTLSDVLGDIPMDHVKKYSIKETKNGRKIIIEVDDSQNIVVSGKSFYLNQTPRAYRLARPHRSNRDVKVIIESVNKGKKNPTEKTETTETPEKQ